MVNRNTVAGIIALCLIGSACSDSSPEQKAGLATPEASGFDFYVLALSWSPSYCAAEGPKANPRQCSSGKPRGFVVHGLWPQFEKGYPEFCKSDQPERVPWQTVNTIIDLIPTAGLIGHQWRKHGTCTGLDQTGYFDAVRLAREAVRIPPGLSGGLINPLEAEQAFMKANRGMPADGIAVTCDKRYLREVRICLSKDMEFHSCPEVDRRMCRLPKAAMPAAR